MIRRHSSIRPTSATNTAWWTIAPRAPPLLHRRRDVAQGLVGLLAEREPAPRDRGGEQVADVVPPDGRETDPLAGRLAQRMRGHSVMPPLPVPATEPGRKKGAPPMQVP